MNIEDVPYLGWVQRSVLKACEKRPMTIDGLIRAIFGVDAGTTFKRDRMKQVVNKLQRFGFLKTIDGEKFIIGDISDDSCIALRLSRKKRMYSLGNTQTKILNILSDGGELRCRDVARRLLGNQRVNGSQYANVLRAMDSLATRGLVTMRVNNVGLLWSLANGE